MRQAGARLWVAAAFAVLCAASFAPSAQDLTSTPSARPAPAANGQEKPIMPKAPKFWYEDNNQRQAGGYPPDFHEMFMRPEKWAKLRGLIDVYYIRGNTLKNILAAYGEPFVRDHFVKVLRDSHIPIAIDNPIGTTQTIPLLRGFGATVSHLAFQSVISKCPPHEVPQRVEEAIRLVVEMKKTFPEIKVGLIDANPTKGRDYQGPYLRLAEGVAAAGCRLDFVHLDCPCDQADSGERVSWEKVKEVERFVQRELGLEFGFICVSAIGGKTSDDRFYRDVMTIPNRYINDGSLPDHFILMSWFPHPARALPEDAPEGEYPMTKTALHLAKALRALPAAPSRAK